jgi:MioC protein
MPITILTASTGGTARAVGALMAERLQTRGFAARCLAMSDATPEVLACGDVLLFCVATFGSGGVPLNAQDFLTGLEEDRAALSALHYGLVGFGDSSFRKTFNGGQARFAAALTARGAKQIGETLLLDAARLEPPEPVALHWLERFCELLALMPEAFGAPPAPPDPTP